jgi:hypothetical protein
MDSVFYFIIGTMATKHHNYAMGPILDVTTRGTVEGSDYLPVANYRTTAPS